MNTKNDPNGDLQKPPPCGNCGHQKEFKGEPDGCLGYVPGIVDACCGHGDPNKAYLHFQNGMVLRGFRLSEPGGEDPEMPMWIMNPEWLDSLKAVDPETGEVLDDEDGTEIPERGSIIEIPRPSHEGGGTEVWYSAGRRADEGDSVDGQLCISRYVLPDGTTGSLLVTDRWRYPGEKEWRT